MLAILLLIYSMKKELLITAYFLLVAAVPMESTAGTIIKYPASKIANVSTRPKIYSVGPGSLLSAKI